jgi:hypothetical protein
MLWDNNRRGACADRSSGSTIERAHNELVPAYGTRPGGLTESGGQVGSGPGEHSGVQRHLVHAAFQQQLRGQEPSGSLIILLLILLILLLHPSVFWRPGEQEAISSSASPRSLSRFPRDNKTRKNGRLVSVSRWIAVQAARVTSARRRVLIRASSRIIMRLRCDALCVNKW